MPAAQTDVAAAAQRARDHVGQRGSSHRAADRARGPWRQGDLRRQRRWRERQHQAAQRQVADPVGDDRHHDDAHHLLRLQASATVQAQLQRQRAHQRTEVEVERIADRGDAQRARRRHAVSGLMPRHQVVAAEQHVAQQREQRRQCQARRWLAQHGPAHLAPVERAGLMGQQRQHQQRQGPRCDLPGTRPQRAPARRRTQRGQVHRVPARCRSPLAGASSAGVAGGVGGARRSGRSGSTFASRCGSRSTHAGKRCRK